MFPVRCLFLAYPHYLLRRFPQIKHCTADRSRRRKVNCRNDWASYWMLVLFAWKWNRKRAKAARTEFADRWNWRPEALEVLKCHCSCWLLRWEKNGLQVATAELQVDCSWDQKYNLLIPGVREIPQTCLSAFAAAKRAALHQGLLRGWTSRSSHWKWRTAMAEFASFLPSSHDFEWISMQTKRHILCHEASVITDWLLMAANQNCFQGLNRIE